jgi:pimeloyl-ACP methyl ester carboxylesterase
VNDVAELKQFVTVHARTQNLLPHVYRPLLDRIRTDGDGPGSWVHEWSAAATGRLHAGDPLGACRYYAMARFPFPDGPARQDAQRQCVSAFESWRQDNDTGIERLDITLPDGTVGCWTSGLSSTDRRPLLLVMGGIVAVKEQWAPILRQARRLGMAGLVTEMPGVGENTLPYNAESWRMLPAVLDAVRDRADVSHTYAVALSFSGHLALRCASVDPRIRGIATSGAPVSDFFTDREWQSRLPRITVDTLAHLTGVEQQALAARLPGWRLGDDELTRLDIPVCYLASSRDEIIPAGDPARLRERVRQLRLMENDDVHGSPRHVTESRLWVALSLLRMRDVHGPQRLVVGSLWRAARLRARLRRAAA